MSNGITEIRPKVVFREIETRYPDVDPIFTVNIPTSDIGGLTLLESAILVSLIKLIDPMEMFEFGTYMGASSVLFAMNSKDNARVTTVDIGAEFSDNTTESQFEKDKLLSSDVDNDNYLRDKFINKGAEYIERANSKVKGKISQLYCNSHKLDLEEHKLKNRFDFIFIDGGHDFETIKNDTLKAYEMAKEDSIIVWHDFRSTIHTNVTDYINEFSQKHKVVHVQATMLAFTLNGKYANLISEI